MHGLTTIQQHLRQHQRVVQIVMLLLPARQCKQLLSNAYTAAPRKPTSAGFIQLLSLLNRQLVGSTEPCAGTKLNHSASGSRVGVLPCQMSAISRSPLLPLLPPPLVRAGGVPAGQLHCAPQEHITPERGMSLSLL